MRARRWATGLAVTTVAAAVSMGSAPGAASRQPAEGSLGPGCSATQVTATTSGGSALGSINAGGDKVAFSSNAIPGNTGNEHEIYLHTVGGGNVKLTEQPFPIGNFGPSIDADGDRIAFISNRTVGASNPDGNYELFVHNVGGVSVQITNQTTWPQNTGFSPALSANGEQVAYSLPNVLRERADNTGPPVPIADSGGDPAIDGDGSRIVFVEPRLPGPEPGPQRRGLPLGRRDHAGPHPDHRDHRHRAGALRHDQCRRQPDRLHVQGRHRRREPGQQHRGLRPRPPHGRRHPGDRRRGHQHQPGMAQRRRHAGRLRVEQEHRRRQPGRRLRDLPPRPAHRHDGPGDGHQRDELQRPAPDRPRRQPDRLHLRRQPARDERRREPGDLPGHVLGLAHAPGPAGRVDPAGGRGRRSGATTSTTSTG